MSLTHRSPCCTCRHTHTQIVPPSPAFHASALLACVERPLAGERLPAPPSTGNVTYYRLTRLGYYSTELTRVTPGLARRDGHPATFSAPTVAIGWPVHTASLRDERDAELLSPAKVQAPEQKPSTLDAVTSAAHVLPSAEKEGALEHPAVAVVVAGVAAGGAPWEGASFDAHPL